jgi:16S rRNA (uracil1498-N3)-methyltransferase
MYLDESVEEFLVGSMFELAGSEGRHAVSVSRLRAGETVVLGNGRGLVAQAETVAVTKSSATLRIESVRYEHAPALNITLVQGLAKGDRDERAVEAATELNVSTIVPWAAGRSISRWDADKAAKGQLRWASIAREASKQSLRAWLPVVEPLELTSQVAVRSQSSVLLVLDPTGNETLSQALATRPDRVTLVVGPEGGLSDDELAVFSEAGAVRVRLGANILRTSTAGPAAIAAINELLSAW